MIDLIRTKDAIEAIKAIPPGNWASARYVREIENVPSVEAVPIEPLCVWLAAYAAPPQYAMNAVAGDPIAPTSCGYPVNSRVEAWKYHFRELLKSGLMDTEGEDAEEKA